MKPEKACGKQKRFRSKGVRTNWVSASCKKCVYKSVVALFAVIVLVAGGLWPGYDTVSASNSGETIWVLNQQASHYGRINTAIGEIESVAPVVSPSTIVQSPQKALLFVDGKRQFVQIDASNPQELLGEEIPRAHTSPEGTRNVVQMGSRILFISDDGTLATAHIEQPGNVTPILVQKSMCSHCHVDLEKGSEGSENRFGTVPLRVDAVNLADENRIVGLVRENDRGFTVLVVEALTGEIQETHGVENQISFDVQIAMVNGTWVVLDVEKELLFLQGREQAIPVDLDGQAKLRTSGVGAVVVADETGTHVLEKGEEKIVRVRHAQAGSFPAVPTQVGGELYAAWLGENGGVLWSYSGEKTLLSYGDTEKVGAPAPKILVSGEQAVLNDVSSGLVWSVPNGALVPTSQNWFADNQPESVTETAQIDDSVEQKPPVAMPDCFGVRAGQDSVLPVLLNDYSSNRSVLSVDPDSLGELDPNFGKIRLANNNQHVVVSVAANASGSASFTYSATSGSETEGLVSEPATVTLEVVPESQNDPPFFAGVGVQNYLGVWPSPSVAPGGTAQVQVLSNWVDPQGDSLMLASATTSCECAQVLADPNGTVTLKHTGGDGDALDPITVAVTVQNSGGQNTTKELVFVVTSEPPIELQDNAIAVVVGKPTVIDLQENASGGTGQLRITEVKTSGDVDTVSVEHIGTKLNITATEKGSYLVETKVEDSAGTTAKNLIRAIAIGPEEASISVPPMTVFVRPFEDTTVDLLSSVQNPAGRVLMASDIEVEHNLGAELSAKIVGQRHVHAFGRTLNDVPGTLGKATYTVSDGSGQQTFTEKGQIVFILTPQDYSFPIAVDKWITVQSGVQVDVPVLEWAHTPMGAQLAVDQKTVVLDQQNGDWDRSVGLAFATPTHIRYLAPQITGEFTIGYSIFCFGDPQLASSATIHVQVISSDDNQLKTLVPLEGRVSAGATVSVEPNIEEAAMRGENYVLDAVVEQPLRGSASIGPDGESLQFTAYPGTSGQDHFTYQVRTPNGNVATGEVHMGILDEDIEVTPILYSRYLQTPVGHSNQISIFPLDNAEDPTNNFLTLQEVWPNEPPNTPQFDVAKKRIVDVNTESGKVVLAAANELGVTSFFYKAESEQGNHATGLIVTKAVMNPTEDSPVVADTKLTAETLWSLPKGVDVLKDQVSWNTGRTTDLKLEMWEPDSVYKNSGSKIVGPIPPTTTTVPFSVEGTSFSGDVVKSYGFLKIPSRSDVPLAVKAGFPTPKVQEGGTVSINLLDAIVDPVGNGLLFNQNGVAASGARAEAKCSLNEHTLIYVAGDGGPWADACVVPVKTRKQRSFTYLSLPISVIAKTPQPTLNAMEIQVSPGLGNVEFNLESMVQWNGGPKSAVNLLVSGNLTMFDWELVGNQVTLKAKDNATPTRWETLAVSLANYPSVDPVTLTAVVGPAAGVSPRGGNVLHTCSAANSTSCVIPVVGNSVAGQMNFFSNSPLTLVPDSVVSSPNCSNVKFSYQNPTSVRASWPANVGGQSNCVGSFVVQDAQGRKSMGANRGTIVLELRGKPAPPQVSWVATETGKLTFRISQRGHSHPETEHFEWSGGGKTGTCSLSGSCKILVGTHELGKNETYIFKSVNSVGTSQGTSVEAWTYRNPTKPKVVEWNPSTDGKHVNTFVEVNAADTGKFAVDSGGKQSEVTVPPTSGYRVMSFMLPVSTSPTSIQVRAHSRLPTPPSTVSIPKSGDATATFVAHSVGAPSISMRVDANENSATAVVNVEKLNGVGGKRTRMQMEVCATSTSGEHSCTTSSNKLELRASAGSTVSFVARAWGVGRGNMEGTKFVEGTVTRQVSIGVAKPVVKGPYSLVTEGEMCLETENCWQWIKTIEPDVSEPPVGAMRYFSFESVLGKHVTVQDAMLQSKFPAPFPRLLVWNEVGEIRSPQDIVPLHGGTPGRVKYRDPSNERCIGSPEHIDPFITDPELFGEITGTPPVETDGKIIYQWTLRLPSGFTVEGADELLWECYVHAGEEHFHEPSVEGTS